MAAPDLMPARLRSTPRSVAAVAVIVGLLLGVASATAWGARSDDESAAHEDTLRRPAAEADTERRTGGASGRDTTVGTLGAPDGGFAGAPGPAVDRVPETRLAGEPENGSNEPDAGAGGEETPLASSGARAGRAEVGDDHREARGRGAQDALEHWLGSHPDVESVAVAFAFGGQRGAPWSGSAVADEAATPIDHHEPYPIMSVTKTFTEALVLREAAQGHIDLDAPMPSIPGVAPVPDGLRVTPRQLLQHSSGLVDYVNASGYDPSAPMTPARAVSLSLGTPVLSEPGTRTHYSNSNFHWLGLLLEHVTGRPFSELVDDLAGHYELASATVDPAVRPGWVGFASGGMRSTLPDVARWGSRLFTPGEVLSPRDLEAYRSVGPLGVGLGIWPICPCSAAPGGGLDYTAIGQIVADGGLLYFPESDVAVAVRLAHVPGDVGTITASVAVAVATSLEPGATARVQ